MKNQTKSSKQKLIVVILLIGLVLIAGLILLLARPKTSSVSAGPAASVKVVRGDIAVTVSATGKLEPKLIMSIHPDPNLPTRAITRIWVKNGDTVHAGQIMATVVDSGLDLDRDSALAAWNSQKARLTGLMSGTTPDAIIQAEASLNQAKISLEQANADLERNKLLFDQGAITQQAWDTQQTDVSLANSKMLAAQSAYDIVKAGTAKADIQSQRSAVAQAESTYRKTQLILDATQIRSPIDGTVTEVLQSVGDLATPSTAMFSVSQIESMIVRGYVDEVDQPSIQVGQTAVVSFDSLPDSSYRGTVTQIDKRATVQSNVTMFTVLIQIPNQDGKLLWGMSATADITTTEARNVLVIPKAAIRTAPGRNQVVVIDGATQYLWDIKTGPSQGSLIQVTAGLSEDDTILAVAPRANASPARSNTQGGNSLLGGPAGGGPMLRGMR